MPRDVSAECHIRIDKNGDWFYQNQQIIHPKILNSFHEALEQTDDDRYLVRMEGEICYIEVEDTPFVVTTLRDNPENKPTLILNSGQTHDLKPSTLHFKDNKRLYATLNNNIPVKFTRAAYYQIGLMMEEDADGIYLPIGATRYYLNYPNY